MLTTFALVQLENCGAVAVYIDDQDHDVFQSLQKVRVERNQEDPRESTVHFDFGENEYFSDKTLTKVFKVTADAEPLGSDDFDFAGSVTTESVKINWKSEEKNLAKKNPSTIENEDELNPGSFFSSLFETDNVQLAATIGDNIINEFYPRAIDYYTGKAEEDYSMYDSFDGDEDDEDDDEEDEEDDDDDDREIDLEAEDDRPSKKSKNWTVS